MTSTRTIAARFAGIALVGGVAAGALMALAVPTTMKNHVGDGWRDLIGAPEVAYDSSSSILYEAPPQDLTPAGWMTASQEYAASGADDVWVEPAPASDLYMVEDYSADLLAASEELPAQVILASSKADSSVEHTDAAAASAEAASEAAADVRAMQNAATPSPVGTDTPDAAVVS